MHSIRAIDEKTELRNRIYNYVVADYRKYKRGSTFSRRFNCKIPNSPPIHLRHTSIKAAKRYKTAKQWANAHKRRHYFGLTQTCRLLRHEFRPLYLQELSLEVDSRLGQFLSIFGHNEESQVLGHRIIKTMGDPLPHHGVDVLPLLKDIFDLKKSRRLTHDHEPSRPFDMNDLFLSLAPTEDRLIYFKNDFEIVVTGITIFKDSERPHPGKVNELALRIDLECERFPQLTQEEKESRMKSLLGHANLDFLDGIYATIRCGNRSYRWYVPRYKCNASYDWFKASRLVSEETY